MGSLVSAIVRWAHRHRGIVVAAVAAATLVSIEGARRLTFDADVLSLLPRDSDVIQSFRTFLARFGSLDQLYVVFTAPERHAMSEYGDQVTAWVEALRSAPEIARVDAGVVDRTRDFGWLAGVDYGIHLVHRFQERGDAERATAELAPVILVAAAITMLGYGTLVTSSYPPLRSIGVVSAVSVVTLAVASVFVLPALLMTEPRGPAEAGRRVPPERRVPPDRHGSAEAERDAQPVR